MLRASGFLANFPYFCERIIILASLSHPKNTRLVLTIVLITLLGIALGYVLRRHRWLQRVEMTIMLTIFVMLFVLGLTVGGNEYVVENLPSLGGLAALIALVAMTGSAVLVSLVYHFFFKERGGGRGDE